MKNGTVIVGYPHNFTTTQAFCHSLLILRDYDSAYNKSIKGLVHAGGPFHHRNRELIVDRFMNQSDAEWLLFIDTNSEFQPNALERLLAVADPVERPIIVPLTASRIGYQTDTDSPLVPMWFEQNELGEYSTLDVIKGGDGLVRIANAGMAMVLLHRSVFEKFPVAERGRNRWFNYEVWNVNGQPEEMGEDMSFFHRCRLLGIPLWGYRGVEVVHWKLRRETVGEL